MESKVLDGLTDGEWLNTFGWSPYMPEDGEEYREYKEMLGKRYLNEYELMWADEIHEANDEFKEIVEEICTNHGMNIEEPECICSLCRIVRKIERTGEDKRMLKLLENNEYKEPVRIVKPEVGKDVKGLSQYEKVKRYMNEDI